MPQGPSAQPLQQRLDQQPCVYTFRPTRIGFPGRDGAGASDQTLGGNGAPNLRRSPWGASPSAPLDVRGGRAPKFLPCPG